CGNGARVPRGDRALSPHATSMERAVAQRSARRPGSGEAPGPVDPELVTRGLALFSRVASFAFVEAWLAARREKPRSREPPNAAAIAFDDPRARQLCVHAPTPRAARARLDGRNNPRQGLLPVHLTSCQQKLKRLLWADCGVNRVLAVSCSGSDFFPCPR